MILSVRGDAMKKPWKRTVMNWMFLDTYLHMHRNEELRLENCRRILEYHDLRVRLQTKDFIIEIWGKNLRVYDYSDNSVIVKGEISSVHLQETR